jgi:lycopene cyclase CruA
LPYPGTMRQLLYLEIPYPTDQVLAWLQSWRWKGAEHTLTPDGLKFSVGTSEFSVFCWNVQRTTYLKLFQWRGESFAQEKELIQSLTTQIRTAFPRQYPSLPAIDPQANIFESLAPHYPLTAQFFQRIPNGEEALKKCYWWEKTWRENIKQPGTVKAKQVLFREKPAGLSTLEFDLVYSGAALGVIHAAMMARLGWKVAVMERGPFGGMNREWNISRAELQSFVEVGLLTAQEVESLIFKEYRDGFNKFHDGNVPKRAVAAVLSTPTVLNVALDAERLLRLCGEKLRAAGGVIIDNTEFQKVSVWDEGVCVSGRNRETNENVQITGRVLIDAMGSASLVAQQLNDGRAFNSVCPTVGAVVEDGFEDGVWDYNLGDVLYSHGDISRGRQLIWELFPGKDKELTFYLFHYHEVHPQNPGSLLELYEDFFAILPEYKRCDLEKLKWKKATFGYIPAYFSVGEKSRKAAYDRVLAIGDAASLQSPLVFTGFGSLVRNLPRLSSLLDEALQFDLVTGDDLDRIRAYQSNITVTWLFSKGMMVPTGQELPPERINAILNTFFGIMAEEDPKVVDDFIKDRAGWLAFNRMAVRAAFKNPMLLVWIWQLTGFSYFLRWFPSYLEFTAHSFLGWTMGGWFPALLWRLEPSLKSFSPRLWHRLLAWTYRLNYSVGKPQSVKARKVYKAAVKVS